MIKVSDTHPVHKILQFVPTDTGISLHPSSHPWHNVPLRDILTRRMTWFDFLVFWSHLVDVVIQICVVDFVEPRWFDSRRIVLFEDQVCRRGGGGRRLRFLFLRLPFFLCPLPRPFFSLSIFVSCVCSAVLSWYILVYLVGSSPCIIVTSSSAKVYLVLCSCFMYSFKSSKSGLWFSLLSPFSWDFM